MEEERNYITLVGNDGSEEIFEEIMRFPLEQFKKNYLVLGKEIVSEDGEDATEIYVFNYVEGKTEGEDDLLPVLDDEELDLCNQVIDSFFSEEE